MGPGGRAELRCLIGYTRVYTPRRGPWTRPPGTGARARIEFIDGAPSQMHRCGAYRCSLHMSGSVGRRALGSAATTRARVEAVTSSSTDFRLLESPRTTVIKFLMRSRFVALEVP